MINLRSDTFTGPSPKMMESILKGDSGDDCYGESVSTNELELYCANYFGTQSAIFMPSGTMANLVAVLASTKPGDEIITDSSYHIHYFESAQISMFSGTSINTIQSLNGILTDNHIDAAINGKYRSNITNNPTLISLENTINTHGGKIFPLSNMKAISDYAKKNNIRIHLDGARLLNACVALKVQPSEYVKLADTTMISFSKGLGAPFGSILLGNSKTIQLARKYRKWLGGGLHQSGFLASAALYALKNNLLELEKDHQLSKYLEKSLFRFSNNILDVIPAETNMVMFSVKNLGITAIDFCKFAENEGLLLFPWDRFKVRAVTHMDVSKEQIREAAEIIKKIAFSRMISNQSYEYLNVGYGA